MKEVDELLKRRVPAKPRDLPARLRFQHTKNRDRVSARVGLVTQVFNNVHLQRRVRRSFLQDVCEYERSATRFYPVMAKRLNTLMYLRSACQMGCRGCRG